VELHDEVHGPLWIVASNDSYEASRLLVPGWLASFRDRVDGNPIAIVPERSLLLVGGDARVEMVERLLDKAEGRFVASTRSVSPALYTVDADGRVIPYVGYAGHPLETRLRLAHERLAAYEYDCQKRALDELHEQRGHDVFVASYQVFEQQGGAVKSLHRRDG